MPKAPSSKMNNIENLDTIYKKEDIMSSRSISSKDKVKALILYICSKIPIERSATTKLNKIVWFCETETMYRTWKPLTGHTFIRQVFGPVALNSPMMIRELIQKGDLYEETEYSNGIVHRLYKTKTKIDIRKYFSDEQIEIIDEQIEKYKDVGSKDICTMAHDTVWLSLEDADEMPLEAYRIKCVYTQEQKEALNKLVQQIIIRGEEI